MTYIPLKPGQSPFRAQAEWEQIKINSQIKMITDNFKSERIRIHGDSKATNWLDTDFPPANTFGLNNTDYLTNDSTSNNRLRDLDETYNKNFKAILNKEW